MSASVFLLLNLALAFYNVGTIWAHEIDIFRTWRLIGRAQFHDVQMVHFRKIPYWIFAPVGLALLGNIALLWYHPVGSPGWCGWAALVFQSLSILLTAAFWGRWQGRLARDECGPESPYLAKILRTHWLRTALINGYALVFLFWTVKVLG
ncbi:hypothetical protein [Tunturiibacter gelidiferens]|uniref:DUF1772 domain-containing protein n=1 Tax=Tunturiibacter gelidiferens TaxID=3069689 RepID=A0AAU7Z1X0_9BACT